MRASRLDDSLQTPTKRVDVTIDHRLTQRFSLARHALLQLVQLLQPHSCNSPVLRHTLLQQRRQMFSRVQVRAGLRAGHPFISSTPCFASHARVSSAAWARRTVLHEQQRLRTRSCHRRYPGQPNSAVRELADSPIRDELDSGHCHDRACAQANAVRRTTRYEDDAVTEIGLSFEPESCTALAREAREQRKRVRHDTLRFLRHFVTRRCIERTPLDRHALAPSSTFP